MRSNSISGPFIRPLPWRQSPPGGARDPGRPRDGLGLARGAFRMAEEDRAATESPAVSVKRARLSGRLLPRGYVRRRGHAVEADDVTVRIAASFGVAGQLVGDFGQGVFAAARAPKPKRIEARESITCDHVHGHVCDSVVPLAAPSHVSHPFPPLRPCFRHTNARVLSGRNDHFRCIGCRARSEGIFGECMK